MAELIKLCTEHAEFEQASYSPVGKENDLAKYIFADQPPVFCLVAENTTGELVGYAAITREFSTWDADYYLHLDCLYLRPQFRNQGIGELMMKEIAAHAVRFGCKQVQWHTPAFNERAVKFYRRIGATEKQKCRFYLNEETIRELTEK